MDRSFDKRGKGRGGRRRRNGSSVSVSMSSSESFKEEHKSLSMIEETQPEDYGGDDSINVEGKRIEKRAKETITEDVSLVKKIGKRDTKTSRVRGERTILATKENGLEKKRNTNSKDSNTLIIQEEQKVGNKKEVMIAKRGSAAQIRKTESLKSKNYNSTQQHNGQSTTDGVSPSSPNNVEYDSDFSLEDVSMTYSYQRQDPPSNENEEVNWREDLEEEKEEESNVLKLSQVSSPMDEKMDNGPDTDRILIATEANANDTSIEQLEEASTTPPVESVESDAAWSPSRTITVTAEDSKMRKKSVHFASQDEYNSPSKSLGL